ncbi:MAG: MMPL family transporter [Geodermatophilaceae bacterium]|nr:MMPL family transporter [Geodermatophilaceae bacterium]
MLGRLGRFCQDRRRLVLAAWVLLVAVGFGVGGQVFDRLEPARGGSSSESIRGLELLEEVAPYAGQVVAVLDGIDADDPSLAEVAATLEGVGGVGRVRWPGSPEGARLVATDGEAVAVIVDLARDLENRDAALADVESVLRQLEQDGAADVILGGDLLLFEEINTQIDKDIAFAELIALPITLVVMVVIFGGLLAAGLPILAAVASIAGALLCLLGFSTVLDLDPNVVPVTTFMGLGLAIDYSLLMVSRFREERGRGLTVDRAVIRTVETAGRTILFSALTVATALSGLFVFAEPIFRAIGAAGVAVVLIALAAALTLVPALLAALGHRIEAPSSPLPDEGAFATLATRVQRRPWLVAVSVSVGLVVLGAPVLGVTFANGGSELLPPEFESRQVDEALAERFPGGGTDPVTVVSRSAAEEVQDWADRAIAGLPEGMVAAVGPLVTLDDGVTVLSVVPDGTSQGDTAKALVSQLRADPAPGESYVTGEAAILVDFQQSIASRAPWAFALVAMATLVLLFLMTGSIVVPVKALVMNTVSLGATFGALVWIFADGNLEGLLGFEATGAIETWVPVLVFAFAFGLSMDYEVFLLARIKEAYDAQPEAGRAGASAAAGSRNDIAVRLGLQRSGRIITCAALVVVIVFAAFATSQMLGLKQMGVALALAVAVDATIVRCLLVPATMTLLGEANWWAPAPLRRLHARFGLSETAPPERGEPGGPAQPAEPVGAPARR